METYQSKNVVKEDIDNMIKRIYDRFEEEKSKAVHTWNKFYYNICSDITLNNIKFRFQIKCFYNIKDNEENWELRHYILNDELYLNFEDHSLDMTINSNYFNSKTLKQLIVKYVNTKFVYDKCDHKIMRYKDYLEEDCVRKLFHTNIECCVCYDNLSGYFKTECNHYICLDCINQIKGKKLCPMCKSCLSCGGNEESDDY